MSNKTAILKMKNDLLAGKTLPVLFTGTLIEAMGERDVTVGDFLGYCEAVEHTEAAVSARLATLTPADVEVIPATAVFTTPNVVCQSPYDKHQPGDLKQVRAAMRRNPFGEN